MAFRAFYALKPELFHTSTGQCTNAVHGFTNTLLRLVKQYKPTHVAVAFDLPGGTFRTREYADYKGGRKATPEEFKGQIELIQDVLGVLGISWLTYEDFEADDIVATLAVKGESVGMRVYLASGDKDSYQLVDDAVTVLYPMPRSEMIEITPQVVEEKTGVPPHLYSDVAALVGEKADNIPGVPGVGPKTAAKWVNQYGGLRELLNHADDVKGKVGQALRDHVDQVKLNRRINQLVRDLPIPAATPHTPGSTTKDEQGMKDVNIAHVNSYAEPSPELSHNVDDFDAFVPRGVDVQAMHDLFDALDFHALRRRVLAELPHRSESGFNAALPAHSLLGAPGFPLSADDASEQNRTRSDGGVERDSRGDGAGESNRESATSTCVSVDLRIRTPRVIQLNTGVTPRTGVTAHYDDDTSSAGEEKTTSGDNLPPTIHLAEFFAQHQGPYGLTVIGSSSPGMGNVNQFGIGANDGVAVVGVWNELSQADQATLRSWLGDREQAKIGHGTKALLHSWQGVNTHKDEVPSVLSGISADTEIDAYVCNPERRTYDLKELAEHYLGVDIEEPGMSEQFTQTALDIDCEAISNANVNDNPTVNSADPMLGVLAVTELNLHDALLTDLNNQPGIEALLQLELDVAHVLFAMEQRGIAVDRDRLSNLQNIFQTRVDHAQRIAREAADKPDLNLSSPLQLQQVLFTDMGLPTTKKTKRGYTTNADALSGLLARIALREDDTAVRGQTFLAAVLEHRDAIKLLQSVQGLERALRGDGRIHTTYQQTVTATGRLSSAEPNLQNIHARTEEGLQIRDVFVPSSGFDYLLTADYSQIEMRLMAHLSGDEELIEAFRAGVDLHRYVAAKVFGISEDAVTPAQRSRIKAMSYGLVYGLSAFGLSAQLNISRSEAQKLMDGYFSRFGKVKHYLDGLVDRARREGYTETLMGRRRYLSELTNTNRQVREAAERMALNAPIQGSAADIIKIAMVATERAMRKDGLRSRILLQVHDELVLEVVASEIDQVKEIVVREMGSAWPELSVPLTVSIGVGRTWRDAQH